MRQALFVFLLLFALSACSKKPETNVFPPSGGTWTVNGVQKLAQISEIVSRKGFQLTFSDKSGVEQLSFLFRTRPESPVTFVAARDTALASSIAVHVQSGGIGYSAVNGVNADVTVAIEDGKLHLTGTRVRLKPDSAADPETLLDFDVKEY